MDAFKRSLGFASNDSSERYPSNLSSSPRHNYELSGGGFDSISASMVVVEGPPSLDQRGAGGCIEEVSEEGGQGLSLEFLMLRVLLICSISAASTDICSRISWDIAELSPWTVWGQ